MEHTLLKTLILTTLYFVHATSQEHLIEVGSHPSSQKKELSKNHESGHGSHISGLFNAYRTAGLGTSISNPTGNTQGYTYSGYLQEPVASPYGGINTPPIFGLSSNGDFQFAAYFGPIFWGCVAAVATIAIGVFIIKIFFGFEKITGFVKNIGEKTGAGKALDLDHLTTLAYKAMDNYTKLNSRSIKS